MYSIFLISVGKTTDLNMQCGGINVQLIYLIIPDYKGQSRELEKPIMDRRPLNKGPDFMTRQKMRLPSIFSDLLYKGGLSLFL